MEDEQLRSNPLSASFFGQSKEFPSALSRHHRGRRSVRMDELVHDLTSALDESQAQQQQPQPALPKKRKAWRRKCKSTSNLLLASGGQQRSPNNSGDEATTEEEDAAAAVLAELGLFSESRGGAADRGTSSLQHSDSDEGNCNMADDDEVAAAAAATVRKKRIAAAKKPTVVCGAANDSSSCSVVHDSSKQLRKFPEEEAEPTVATTKRRRRLKRIALDPTASGTGVKPADAKAKRGRRRMAAKDNVDPFVGPCTQQPLVSGMRKRSHNNEPSCSGSCPSFETGRAAAASRMDVEEQRSSSSLSSDDDEEHSHHCHFTTCDEEAREADDEQSDWPGHDDDNEEGKQLDLLEDGELNLTSRRRPFLPAAAASTKRFPLGRASRRLRSRQQQSEQVARFLQDPRRAEMRLSAVRPSDRNKVVHLAGIYSLSVRCEGVDVMVLTKTVGRRAGDDEGDYDDDLLLPPPPPPPPKPPCGPSSVADAKRRRRDGFPEQPNAAVLDDDKSTSTSSPGEAFDASAH